MTTSNFFILAEPPQSAQARTKDPPCVETKKSSFTQLNAKAEPETRLWKICSEIAPQRLSGNRMDCVTFLRSLSVPIAGLLRFRMVPSVQQRSARTNRARYPNQISWLGCAPAECCRRSSRQAGRPGFCGASVLGQRANYKS